MDFSNIIYDNTILNFDLSKIIFKYIDYNVDSLLNIVNTDKFTELTEYERNTLNNTPLIDLILMCVNLGCVGFFLTGSDQVRNTVMKFYENDIYITNKTLLIYNYKNNIDGRQLCIRINKKYKGKNPIIYFGELIAYSYNNKI